MSDAQTMKSTGSAVPISVAHGDGIGPEIMEAVLHILREAGANLQIEVINIGAKLYERGHSTGIDSAAWESIYRTKVLLKAPITTPQGGGYKSLNVTMRKQLAICQCAALCVLCAFCQNQSPEFEYGHCAGE